jgi:hypothetical protein
VKVLLESVVTAAVAAATAASLVSIIGTRTFNVMFCSCAKKDSGSIRSREASVDALTLLLAVVYSASMSVEG